MTGLILKLAPHERVLINGAVIENGDRRARIAIKTPHANILRIKDAIHPDAVNSPVARLCYICQMILTGDAPPDEGRRQIIFGIEQLSQIFTDDDSKGLLSRAIENLNAGEDYHALKSLKALLPREADLIALYRS